MGPLFTVFNNQGRYMLNNVDVRIRFSRQQDKFCLMAPRDDRNKTGYKLEIEKAVLYVQKSQHKSQSVQMAIETVLRNRCHLQPFQRTDMKSFTIGQGNSNFTREHI